MRRNVRGGLPLAAASIAVACGGTMLGGTMAALHLDPGGPPAPAPRAAASTPLPPRPSAPVTVVGERRAAPLRRVVPPDLLVVAGRPIGQGETRSIRRLARVKDLITVDAGAVRLQGRTVNTFAVDPSRFRSWTPPGTAQKQELWAALARQQFVASDVTSRTLRLSEGARYVIAAKTSPSVTLGGSAALGLPGVDVLVSRRTGNDMGLVADLAVMINAPGADLGKLSARLRRILGGNVQVLNLHTRENRLPVERSAPAGRPSTYLDLYRQAAHTCPGLSWTVLAAIGQVESDHGRNTGPSTAGALGPMQFLPSTWRSYGVDGDADGKADIMDPYDAVPAAARYLCANGAGQGGSALYQAVWRYNHSDSYVRRVLALAQAYARQYG